MSQKQTPNQGSVAPQLVVMAAGIGSRYGGLKQIDPVGPSGENVLDYSVYDAVRAGFGKVIFIIRRDIEDIFREKVGRNVEDRIETAYVFQELDLLPPGFNPPAGRTKPWGTTHAALCARAEVTAPFAAINADDFYSAEAFEVIAAELADRARHGESDHYCMVGYRLTNTLSEHGHVSRGVCEVTPDDHLQAVVERTQIQRFPDAIKYASGEDEWTSLADDTTISMNMWGFTPDFFEHLDAAFRAFLKRDLTTPRAESYIPTVVNDLIQSGRARVKVLRTDARWFGVTYQEDKAAVQKAIRKLVEAGRYPLRLWE